MTELETDCKTVQKMLNSQQPFLLLDCREEFEWQIGHIPGATLIPMSQLAARIEELSPHKLSPIIVYCHHGVRSLNVTHWLRQQQFQNVRSMRGGIDAWTAEIDPTVPRY